MAFTETLHNSDEYREIAGEPGEGNQPSAQVQGGQTVAQGQGFDPVLQLEKGDVEFWMKVLTVILLFLIYRELAHANGHSAIQGLARGANG